MYSQFDHYLNARIARSFVPTKNHLHQADAEALHQSDRHERMARVRFYRLYRLRNLLFRLNPRLARRIAL